MPGSNGKERIEVITSVQRRRRFTVEEKLRLVEEAESPGMSVSYVARKYNISSSQLFKWRKLANEGKLCAVSSDESVVGISEFNKLKAQVRELERLLGRKTLENEILKEAVEIAQKKKWILRAPLLPTDDTK
jgi:transposase